MHDRPSNTYVGPWTPVDGVGHLPGWPTPARSEPHKRFGDKQPRDGHKNHFKKNHFLFYVIAIAGLAPVGALQWLYLTASWVRYVMCGTCLLRFAQDWLLDWSLLFNTPQKHSVKNHHVVKMGPQVWMSPTRWSKTWMVSSVWKLGLLTGK